METLEKICWFVFGSIAVISFLFFAIKLLYSLASGSTP